MNKLTRSAFFGATVLTSIWLFSAALFASDAVFKKSDKDIVVVLHDLGRSKTAMWLLASRVGKADFRIVRIGYHSLRVTPEKILQDIDSQIERCCIGKSPKIYFVGHSLGGLMIKAYLAKKKVSKLEKNCQRLMSVPGIGPIISTAMVAAIGKGEAFERGRDFGAWIGLVPRQYSTGGKSILGSISKRGNKHLRTLFIQAANVILMRPQNWGKFSFGSWLTEAAKRMYRNKLATALANKLARIAWSVLCHNKRFDEALVI